MGPQSLVRVGATSRGLIGASPWLTGRLREQFRHSPVRVCDYYCGDAPSHRRIMRWIGSSGAQLTMPSSPVRQRGCRLAYCGERFVRFPRLALMVLYDLSEVVDCFPVERSFLHWSSTNTVGHVQSRSLFTLAQGRNRVSVTRVTGNKLDVEGNNS